MPSATLHLSAAELLAESAELAAPLREAMQQEKTCTRLGAMLVDLPFYTNIVTMMVGYWLELPAEDCPLAQKMHRYHPDLFAWHVLGEVSREGMLSRAQRLAIMGGFFSHVALDLELHPLVNWCARRDVILYGGNESHHHRLAEKYHSLFFHLEHCGGDIVGSPRVFTETTRIVEDSAVFRVSPEHPVIRWCCELLAGFFHEAAPSMRQFAHWVRSFRHFGLMISLPPAARNSERLGNPANRERYFENVDFSFMEYWRRSFCRAIALTNLAYEVVERADFSPPCRETFLGRAQITDLAEPPERSLPSLPDYRALASDLRATG